MTAAESAFFAHRQHLIAHMNATGIDAYFACAPNSMGYLHGYFEYSYERLLVLAFHASGESRMICPALSLSQAERCGIENARPWTDGGDPLDLVRELSTDWNLRSAMIAVDDSMSARHLLELQAALPAALFQRGGPLISELRRIKDANEIDTMREAGRIADEAFEDVAHRLRPGMTEVEVQSMLSDSMRARGGQPTFAIAAFGAASAEPHHIGDDTRLAANDLVLLDFGCQVRHYQSDITRCVVVGTATERMHHVYDVVHQAFRAGRAAIQPGRTGADVDAAARSVIADAGFGPKFVHRLGHGIGLDGHEEPNLVSNNDRPLEIGNCVSVEPGIYLPGEFGVRIENIVTVTSNGHDSLNAEPDEQLREIKL